MQQVYDRYAAAIGGRDAWASVQHRTDSGTAEITAAGVTAGYLRLNSAPDRMRMVLDLSALGAGRLDQGFDGTVGWVEQPGQGAVRMTPEQVANVVEASTTGGAFLDPSRYASASVDAVEPFDGVSCYKLSVTTKGGQSRTEYFEVESGLRRGVVTTTPMGQQQAVFTEYKAFEGKKVATRQVQSSMQGDIVIVLASVRFAPIDPAAFTPPAGIK